MRMQLPPPPFAQKAQMRADHRDHAELSFDVDADGAARLQPRQGQAFNPTDVEVAMHENRVAVPAEADIRRGDIGHAIGRFGLEDGLRQCRAARRHAPVGLLQNQNIGLAFQQDLLHPLGVAPPIEAHGLADVVAYDPHRAFSQYRGHQPRDRRGHP
jgi:hypothetical protein